MKLKAKGFVSGSIFTTEVRLKHNTGVYYAEEMTYDDINEWLEVLVGGEDGYFTFPLDEDTVITIPVGNVESLTFVRTSPVPE